MAYICAWEGSSQLPICKLLILSTPTLSKFRISRVTVDEMRIEKVIYLQSERLTKWEIEEVEMDVYNVQRDKLNKQDLKNEEVDELGNLLIETVCVQSITMDGDISYTNNTLNNILFLHQYICILCSLFSIFSIFIVYTNLLKVIMTLLWWMPQLL